MIQYEDKQITVFESALFKTTTTVIEQDDSILIVDPNWLPNEVKQVQAYVQKIRKGKQLYLFFTHSDYDHIIGYRAFPEAKVIASRELANSQDKEKILKQIRDFDDQYYIERDYPIEFPSVDFQISGASQNLKLESSILNFYQGFGHNPDGLLLHLMPLNILIVGDYLSDVEFPYIYHSSKKYEKTLATLKQLINQKMPKLLIPGHGNCTSDIAEMNHRIDISTAYIKTLRQSIQDGLEYSFETLMVNYKFPGIMRQFHKGNIKLIKAEILAKK